MLPKKLRIIIIVSPNGTLNALPAAEYRHRKCDRFRQWRVIATFSAPLARLGKGWSSLRTFAYGVLIRQYGL